MDNRQWTMDMDIKMCKDKNMDMVTHMDTDTDMETYTDIDTDSNTETGTDTDTDIVLPMLKCNGVVLPLRNYSCFLQ
jgi:hypothetical protein